MLSTTLPVRWAVAPQELLPIMPPSVQFMCVAGSGPNRRPVSASCRFRTSSTMPGCTTQVRASASTDSSSVQYLEKSSTTAVLVHWPARLVPPPRDRTGAPNSRATAIAATASSGVRGTTTPIGTWRKLDASVEYAAAGAVVEADFALHLPTECRGERAGVEVFVVRVAHHGVGELDGSHRGSSFRVRTRPRLRAGRSGRGRARSDRG